MPEPHAPHLGGVVAETHWADRHIYVARITLPDPQLARALRRLTGPGHQLRRINRLVNLGGGWHMLHTRLTTQFVYTPQGGMTAQQAQQFMTHADASIAYMLPWPQEAERVKMLSLRMHYLIRQRWYGC